MCAVWSVSRSHLSEFTTTVSLDFVSDRTVVPAARAPQKRERAAQEDNNLSCVCVCVLFSFFFFFFDSCGCKTSSLMVV